MIDEIRSAAAATDFDFRAHAAPGDPLRHRFDDWVPYYRTKYAIAQVLAPRSILEIGVRYGYSAVAFLAAAPGASYVGIDNGSGEFGGEIGAIEWAEAQLRGRDARILRLDSQRLDTLPGDHFDLVHVDGQQDGDGTYHDLTLALEKGRWILVDGYLWSRENMLSTTYFIEKYRAQIESVRMLPGYAGELLIETRARPGRPVPVRPAQGHEALREAYDDAYFLQDCGGHEAFKQSGGRTLADPRLIAMYHLGSPRAGERVLDLGCGRGELAYAAFRAGADVTGLDYSSSAIAIARRTYADALGERLRFVEADVLAFEPDARFDLVWLGDVVEHLAPDALDATFARVARWLAPGGRVVVHTWPNRIAYLHAHRLRREAARAAGTYLPPSPRTYYEDLMHINEQTPARLARTMRRHLPSVRVWAGSAADPLAGLGQPTRDALRRHDSVFAVAGAAYADAGRVRAALRQDALPPDTASRVRLLSLAVPPALRAGERVEARVVLENRSDAVLRSLAPFPVHLSYHWLRDAQVVVHDGVRSALFPPLAPGERGERGIEVVAPEAPGRYTLAATLVQEGCFWFDAADPDAVVRLDLDVAAR